MLAKDCFHQFIPDRTPHAIPRDCDRIAPEILNYDGPADGEHGIELLRFHACICPKCLSYITTAWGLPSPDERATIPVLTVPPRNSAKDDYEDRDGPPDLTDDEVDEALREIAEERERRKRVSPAVLRIFVDGLERATLDFKSGGRVVIPVDDTEEVVEIVSEGGDVLLRHLATHADEDFRTATRTEYRLGEFVLCFDDSHSRAVTLEIHSLADLASSVYQRWSGLLLDNGCDGGIALLNSADSRVQDGVRQLPNKSSGGHRGRPPVAVFGLRLDRMKWIAAGIAGLLICSIGIVGLTRWNSGVTGPHIAQNTERVGSQSAPNGQRTGGVDGSRSNSGSKSAHGGSHPSAPSADVARVPSRVEVSAYDASAAESPATLRYGITSGGVPVAEQAITSAPLALAEPARLLWLPTPSYTEEARRQRVTGKVVLEVELSASGRAKFLRVRSGLGHGLDEAAISAVSQIRFQPAVKDGVPVDSISTIDIRFGAPGPQHDESEQTTSLATRPPIAQPEKTAESKVLDSSAPNMMGSQANAATPPHADVLTLSSRAEDAFISNLSKSTPLAEAYFQRFAPAEEGGVVPDSDRYLLGRFVWTTKPTVQDLLNYQETRRPGDPEKSIADQRMLDGLLQAMVPDWKELTPDRYEHSFVGRDILGTLDCLVYDVRPKNPEDGGFTGRIFVEDRTFNLVRFTGGSAHLDAGLDALRNGNSRFRVDSWRMNVAGNRWVPAYAYVEEVPPVDSPQSHVVKGQIRFWGYDRAAADQLQSTAALLRTSPSAGDGKWRSPLQAQRAFDSQAEQNVLSRLSRAGLLATPGDVERMLDQVLANLILASHAVLEQPIHCRILLTSRLEAFSVGQTIVLSRGLVDVLPNESAIALILAHQLAHNVLGHREVDTKLAFPDVLNISDAELLAKLRFRHSPAEEAEADAQSAQILEESAYKSTMVESGSFLQAIRARAKQLSSLIEPSFGEHLADLQQLPRSDVIFRSAPVYGPSSSSQVAALPLGSRLFVDPWDGRVELVPVASGLPPTPYERAAFAVTPFAPYLQYFAEKSSIRKSSSGKTKAPGSVRKPTAPLRHDDR